MSLIVTEITRKGIVHVCDSLVTFKHRTEERQKLFTVPYLDAALTVAGVYSFGGFRMDEWMQDFIQQEGSGRAPTFADFAKDLMEGLQTAIPHKAMKYGCMVHMAGYVNDGNGGHPEFWFIRNIHTLDSKGNYGTPDLRFELSEDFWTRDYGKQETQNALNQGGFQVYANGSREGRVSFMTFGPTLGSIQMSKFLRQMGTSSANFTFEPPTTIEEYEASLKEAVEFISHRLPDPMIGGKIASLAISQPPNLPPW